METDIHKLIESKETALRYIRSCQTLEQVDTMRKYLERYQIKVEDFLSFQKLTSELDDVELNIKNQIE